MKLSFHWHVPKPRIPSAWLRACAAHALTQCVERPGPHPPALPALDAIEISFVDDTAMSCAHARFLDDPSPTDVITFPYGEILIGADFARRQAEVYGATLPGELLLYIIHAFLHLNGHEDKELAEAAAMRTIQEEILSLVMERFPPPYL